MHIRNALLYHGRGVAQDLRHESDAASATGRSARHLRFSMPDRLPGGRSAENDEIESDRRSHRVHTAQDQGRATADRAGSAESDCQRDRSPLQRSGWRQAAALHLRAEIQYGDQADFQSRRIETAGYGHKPHHPRRRKEGALRDRLVASGPPDIRRKSIQAGQRPQFSRSFERT